LKRTGLFSRVSSIEPGRGRRRLALKPGYSLEWSGQYVLLYLNTRSAAKAGIVMLAVPFSVVGAVWLMYALGYNVSIGPGWG
jgi:Cu(I)/Ag(I) efflux system membrane protein CusA/SilA